MFKPGNYQGTDVDHDFHPTEAYTTVRGFLVRTEGPHFVVYDGSGNKTWFIDTTSATASLVLPDAKAELGKFHTIVQTAGVNPILTYATSGNVDGTLTYSASTAFYRLTSDGTNFWRCG